MFANFTCVVVEDPIVDIFKAFFRIQNVILRKVVYLFPSLIRVIFRITCGEELSIEVTAVDVVNIFLWARRVRLRFRVESGFVWNLLDQDIG